MARPTKMNDSILEAAQAYLDREEIQNGLELATIEGLALAVGINRDTVYEWEKSNEVFSDIVSKLRSEQAQKLIQNALQGKYNASIAKLILSGKHGYVEKSESDITSNGESLGAIDGARAEQLLKARRNRTDT